MGGARATACWWRVGGWWCAVRWPWVAGGAHVVAVRRRKVALVVLCGSNGSKKREEEERKENKLVLGFCDFFDEHKF